MAEIPLNANPPFVVVDVVTNGQITFAFDFRVDDVGDLRAEYRPASGPSVLYTGGDDFTATDIGTETGGEITLTSFTATVAGDKIAIYRDTVIERRTDYIRDFFAADVNAEQDKVFMILQELARDLQRTVKATIGGVSYTFAADLQDGDTLMKSGDLIVRGPNAADIASAQSAAAIAVAARDDAVEAVEVILDFIPEPDGSKADTWFLTPKADGSGYKLTNSTIPDATITDAKIAPPGIWAQLSRYLAPGDPTERVNRSVIEVLNDYSNSILNYKNGAANPVSDGSTDQSSALARALANNKQVFIPPVGAGFAFNGSMLNLEGGQSIVGVAGKSKIVHIGSTDLFRLNGFDNAVKNLIIESGLVTGSAWTFRIDTSVAGSDERTTLENLVTNSGLNFLRDMNGPGIGVTLRLRDIHCRGHRGAMIELRDFFAFVEWQNLLCDRFGVAGGNVPGFNVFNLEGGLLINCETTGSMGLSGVGAGQIGMNFENCKALVLIRPMGDNCGDVGLRLRLCEGTQIFGSKTNLNNAAQLLVSGGKDTQIMAPEAIGRRGVGTPAAGIHNIYIEDGAQDVEVVAANSRQATGAGLYNFNGTRVRVNGGIYKDNGDVGLRTANSASYLRGKSIMFAGNVVGNYVLAGASDKLSICDLNSGAEVSPAVGASSG